MKVDPGNVLNDAELKFLHPTFHLIIHFHFFLGLLSRSRITRVLIFVPILVSSMHALLYRTVSKDNLMSLLVIVQTVLRASDALVINDVSRLRVVGQNQETNQLGVWDRVKWAFNFLFSFRLVGWMEEPRHILPPHPTESRWQFVRSRIVRCLCYIAISDFAQTIIEYIPADGWRETSIKGIGARLLLTIIIVVVAWSFIILPYTVVATVAVGFGLTDASEWPPIFGKWSDAYTVRRFWGRTWHQGLRRIVSTHGDFVAFRLIRLQKKTFWGANVHRYVAFTISGIIHAAIDYGILRSGFWERQTSLTFFILQATVIMFEQEVGKFLGLKTGKRTRRAGYVWTFLWFTLTLLPWMDLQIRFGQGIHIGIWKTGSMTTFLWRGEWTYEAL
ncbi:membrane bound O-acyl transferase family-domain-containing protein [Cyathus striatus]|nr:membrane bound O-acyl transferase family-domain-containing protein [Cyathus striatus]